MKLWFGLRRPLLFAFFLGCTVSFLTSRALTLRLIVPAMIYWSFVPLIEIAALAAVCCRDWRKNRLPWLIDEFFQGNGPWLLWLTGVCAIWCLLSPSEKQFDWNVSSGWVLGGGALTVAWSLHIDFDFFRSVLRRPPAEAIRELALQRIISWSLIAAIVGAPTIWSTVTGRLW